jgi:hypothetical protein
MHMTGLLLKNDRFRSGLHSLSDVKQDASLENPRVGGSTSPLRASFYYINALYPAHSKTRRFSSEMMRKLSVT